MADQAIFAFFVFATVLATTPKKVQQQQQKRWLINVNFAGFTNLLTEMLNEPEPFPIRYS